MVILFIFKNIVGKFSLLSQLKSKLKLYEGEGYNKDSLHSWL